MSLATRTTLAAFGIGLGLSLSVLQAVPALYYWIEGPSARGLLVSIPLATEAVILAFLVFLRRALGGRRPTQGLRRAAAVAAVLAAVSLAVEVLRSPSPLGSWGITQTQYLLWLFGDVLGYFAWFVFLVLFARDPDPLSQSQTRMAALLLAATTVVGAYGVIPLLFPASRGTGSSLWLLPGGPRWQTIAPLSMAAIQLFRSACLVAFFLGIARRRVVEQLVGPLAEHS